MSSRLSNANVRTVQDNRFLNFEFYGGCLDLDVFATKLRYMNGHTYFDCIHSIYLSFVPKNFNKILKQLRSREEIQTLVAENIEKDEGDIASPLKLLINEDNVTAYGDDIKAFVNNINECIKIYSKSNTKGSSKKRSSMGITEFFDQLLIEHLPEAIVDITSSMEIDTNIALPVSSKRKSHSAADESDLTILNTTMKNDLKSLVNKMAKNPLAIPFLYPVDARVYPEYYDMIQNPMDFTALKSKLPDYKYLQDGLNDIRLIWDNCMIFNQEGSQIYADAAALSQTTEALIEEIFGAQYKLASKSSSKNKRKSSNSLSVDVPVVHPSANVESKSPTNNAKSHHSNSKTLSSSHMKEIINKMTSAECSIYFLEPVVASQAPGYFKIIKQPMDLRTFKEKFSSGIYKSDHESFIHDMNKIWENCLIYNDSKSAIAGLARNFRELFKTELIKVLGADVVAPFFAKSRVNESSMDISFEEEEIDATVKSKKPRKSRANDSGNESVNEDPNLPNNKQPNLVLRACRRIWREISNQDISVPFRLPIKDPHYLSVIKKPMDLSTLKINIPNYAENPAEFLKDLLLIFDNCKKYNRPDSDLHRDAEILHGIAQQKFEESFAMKGGQWKVSIPKMKKNDSLDEKNLIGLSGDEHSVSLIPSKSLVLDLLDDSVAKVLQPTTEKSRVIPAKAAFSESSQLSIEEQLKQLNEMPSHLIPSVRERAVQQSLDAYKAMKAPHVIAPKLYEVKNFGEIQRELQKDLNYLYPTSYSCSRTVMLCLKDPEGTVTQRLPIEVVSIIANAENLPTFQVCLNENGTIISEGSSPLQAWEGFVTHAAETSRIVGNNLKRCRSVFNRLCVSPDAAQFYEQIPLTSTEYYKNIKAPMWFRVIHDRLVTGEYDSEFDFAWDVRLIFSNATLWSGLKKDSSTNEASQRLSDLFENLFAYWVLNIRDISIDDHAKGEWDKWQSLKYFDSSLSHHFCTLSKEVKEPAELKLCVNCNDEYLQSVIESSMTDPWHCPRCVSALDMSNNDLSGEPFANLSSKSLKAIDSIYGKEEAGGNNWIPLKQSTFPVVSDYSSGWFQAKKKMRAGVKNWFMSPLGYEVGKDQILDQISFEAEINENLVSSRAKEFKADNSNSLPITSNSKSKVSTKRHTRKSGSTHNNTESEIVSDKVMNVVDLESNYLSKGKLVSYEIPPGHKWTWFVCGQEMELIDMFKNGTIIEDKLKFEIELNVNILPSTGFFGFDIQEIKGKIETLDGSILCQNYRFMASNEIFESLKNELTQKKLSLNAHVVAEETIANVLKREKFSWQLKRLFPVPPNQISSENQHYKFNPLFSHNLNSHQSRVLLSVWDYLDSSKNFIGIHAFCLTDLVKSLDPPKTNFTSYGDITFNEFCCILSENLYAEVRTRIEPISENSWQDILMTKPCNLLTWPQIALEAIRIISSPMSAQEIIPFMETNLKGNLAVAFDILFLLFNHPLIEIFVRLQPVNNNNNNEIEDMNKIVSNFLQIRSNFVNSFTIQSQGPFNYSDLLSLCDSIVSLFIGVITADSLIDTDTKLIAKKILEWFHSITSKIGIITNQQGSIEIALATEINETQLDFNTYCKKFRRPYGCFSLRNVEMNIDEILVPQSFENNVDSLQYTNKLRVLQIIEKSLMLLSTVEPEEWKLNDRIVILEVLLEHCLVLNKSQVNASNRQNSISNRFRQDLGFSDLVFLKPKLDIYIPKNPNAVLKCYFSTIASDSLPVKDNKWVKVPPEYLQDNNLIDNNGEDIVALEKMMLKVIEARQSSETAQVLHKNKIEGLLPLLAVPATSINNIKNYDIHRSRPLGYDRYGNSFWILTAQESLTIFPHDTRGLSFGSPDNPPAVEPCVLMQDKKGWWGYHNGQSLISFVNSFATDIPCEQDLRANLIERLVTVRKILYSESIKFKYSQLDWIDRRLRSERWINEINRTNLNLNVSQFIKLSEIIWARSVEVRMYNYYSLLYKDEPDIDRKNSARADREAVLRRNKKLRDLWQDECFDYNPYKGWVRLDILSRLRQLSCSTTATRIHSDSTLYTVIQRLLKMSPILKKHIPIAPVVNDVNTTSAEANKTSNTSNSTTYPTSDDKINNNNTVGENVNEKENVPSTHTQEVEMKVENDDNKNDQNNYNTSTDQLSVQEVEMKVENDNNNDNNQVKQSSNDILDNTHEIEMLNDFDEFVNENDFDDNGDADVQSNQLPTLNILNISSQASNQNQDYTISLPTKTSKDINSTSLIQSFPHQFANNEAVSDYLNKYLPSNQNRTKCIEQLHIQTGEVLRVYPSGREAAAFMNVSQSGISLCCNGLKPDCYGFRWRIYEGPTINFAAIESMQMPLVELKKLQVMRGKGVDPETNGPVLKQFIGRVPLTGNHGLSSQPIHQSSLLSKPPLILPADTDRLTRQSALIAKEHGLQLPLHGQPQQQGRLSIASRPWIPNSNATVANISSTQHTLVNTSQPMQPKFQPQLIPSIVIVTPRLLKLKIELISIFYTIPEKTLKWPDLDAATEQSINESVTAAINQHYQSTLPPSERPAINASQVNMDENSDAEDGKANTANNNAAKQAEKIGKKTYRRLKRRKSAEKFLQGVQQAINPTQLMEMVLFLENALPPAIVYIIHKKLLPGLTHVEQAVTPDGTVTSKTLQYANNTSLAEVALRIFVLDRSICYDDIKGIELSALLCPFKLRTYTVPFCGVTANCTKYFCHLSKCNPNSFVPSRIIEPYDPLNPTSSNFTNMILPQEKLNINNNYNNNNNYGRSNNVLSEMNSNIMNRNNQNHFGNSNNNNNNNVSKMTNEEFMEIMKKRMEMAAAKDALQDIEQAIPYVPSMTEVTATEWI
eukprot:gene5944-8193_t